MNQRDLENCIDATDRARADERWWWRIFLGVAVVVAFILGVWTGRGTHPALSCQEDEYWTRFTPNGPACVHGDHIAYDFAPWE